MKTAQRLIVLFAAATLIVLIVKIDLQQVALYLSQVGWGFALILVQETMAHSLNAIGWRFTFPKREAKAFSFPELLRLRITGDAVNYLTPSATIAGEFIRAAALNDSHTSEIRYASVAVAKFTQALGQALFVLTGLIFVTMTAAVDLKEYQSMLDGVAWFLVAVLAAFILYVYWAWRRIPSDISESGAELEVKVESPEEKDRHWISVISSVPGQCKSYFRRHPGRFALSTGWFFAAYAWGTFEAFLICRFLGVPIDVTGAFMIEVLSTFVDGVLFMVPAKLGTQEAGKTAIFTALGLKASAGFAFGVVRHFRELAWSGFGIALSAFNRPKGARPAAVEPVPLLPAVKQP